MAEGVDDTKSFDDGVDDTKSFDNTNKAAKFIKCICGWPLTKCVAKELYQGYVGCDACSDTGKDDDIFWHCDKIDLTKHRDGYDICHHCYCAQLIAPIKQQNEIMSANNNSSNSDCNNTADCEILTKFITLMKKYNENPEKSVGQMDTSYLLRMLNYYIHIIHQHDTDESFQDIFNKLGCCDLNNCYIFIRNNRNRIKNSYLEQQTEDNLLTHNIMDKMHCYFHHSFDTGHRLSCQERLKIANTYSTADNIQNADAISSYLSNQMVTETNKVIQQNREKYKTILSQMQSNINNKYNQMFQEPEEEMKEDTGLSVPVYKIGYMFKYGYTGEKPSVFQAECKKVSAKYTSLKEELTQNMFSRLTIQQFNNEYWKCLIHFNSDYCKRQKGLQSYETDVEDGSVMKWNFSTEYLLALMVYCNYTQLQYYFSKTYRDSNGKYHDNFYFLGAYIKISVHQFGTAVNEGNVWRLYHGIGQRLYFPHLVSQTGHGYVPLMKAASMKYISFYGPLSTSSSLEVGLNFTNHKNGLVMQFNKDPWSHRPYFSCSWLSDFGNEKEHLFIQMGDQNGLLIGNIIDAKLGIEYIVIVKALMWIKDIADGTNLIENENDDKMRVLVSVIMENQLSKTLKQYSSFKSLATFARTLLDSFFEMQQRVTINYEQCEKYGFDYLYYTYPKWINLDSFLALFPKLRSITISNVDFCAAVIDQILGCQQSSVRIQLENPIENNENNLSVKEIVDRYSQKFTNISRIITAKLNWNHIYIETYIPSEFATEIVTWNHNEYFGKDIEVMIDKFVRCRLSDKSDNVDQESFNKGCDELQELEIHFDGLIAGKGSYISHLFCNSNCTWIQLEILGKLFPNIHTLKVNSIEITSGILENIFHNLHVNKSKICEITFSIDDENDISILENLITEYQQQYQIIDFSIDIKENQDSFPAKKIMYC